MSVQFKYALNFSYTVPKKKNKFIEMKNDV